MKRPSLKDDKKHKKVEKELKNLSSFPQLNPNPVVELNRNGKVSYCNPAALKQFPGIIKKGSAHPFLKGIFNKQDKIEDEVRIGDRWYLRHSYFVEGKDIKHIYCLDITEHKKAEDELRERERKLKTIFDMLPVGVSILDAKRKIIYVNPAMERILGISMEGLFRGDHKSRKYLRPDGTPMPAEEYASVRAVKEQRAIYNVETGVVKEDSSIVWTDVSAVPVKFPDWNVVIVTSDITERKKAEEKLIESEARYRHISSIMSDIAYLCRKNNDNSYSIEWITGAAEKITGYSINEIKAKRCWKFLVVKEDLPLFEKHVVGLSSGSSSSCELRLRHKNGDIVWVASFAKCLQEPEGQGYRLYGGLMDITERKRSEKELQEAERYRMTGTFISGIAHEIRNPLVSVKGFFQLLNDKETGEKDKQEIAGLAVNEIKRMESLLDSLLNFARPSKGKLIDSDIHKLINDSISLIKHTASKQRIKMITRLDAGHSHLLIDPKNIQQVFLNLSMNALDAMKNGGTLRISTSYLKDQNMIRVTFRDTGRGIKKEHIPRLFEPFFTTKENGTGLGLPISQRIIENYKGKMTVESKEGKGTSVHVTLPAL